MAKKGSCGKTPRVGKAGDPKPTRRGSGARSGTGRGTGPGRRRK